MENKWEDGALAGRLKRPFSPHVAVADRPCNFIPRRKAPRRGRFIFRETVQWKNKKRPNTEAEFMWWKGRHCIPGFEGLPPFFCLLAREGNVTHQEARLCANGQPLIRAGPATCRTSRDFWVLLNSQYNMDSKREKTTFQESHN